MAETRRARLRRGRQRPRPPRARQRGARARLVRLLRPQVPGTDRVWRPDRADRGRRPRLARGPRVTRAGVRRAPGARVRSRHRRFQVERHCRLGPGRSGPRAGAGPDRAARYRAQFVTLGARTRYPRAVPKNHASRRFAERSLVGIDDVGNEERITLWIEYQPDSLWAVGRVVNPQLRDSDEAKEEDYIFHGFELDDALNEANGALSDDLRVSREEGIESDLEPFSREEILARLERWFFHHNDESPSQR